MRNGLSALTVLAGLATLGATVAACSSDAEGGDSIRDGNGTGGALDFGDDDTGAAGNDGSGLGELVGGIIDKTDEEVDAMEDASCTGWSAEPESVMALLMIIVDTSRSMDYPARDGDPDTKWAVTAAALNEAIDTIPSSTPLGLMFYPNQGLYSESTPQEITQCVDVSSLVPVAPDQRDALHSSVAQATPDGCTPTHGAYTYGLENGLRVAEYPGDKYVVIITDGQPTLTIDCMGSCSPADPVPVEPIQEAIAAAYADDGTRTFVIGSPGSERNETTGEDVRAWMSHAAVMGGTAPEGCQVDGPDNFCHFDMSVIEDFGAGLRNALASITGMVVQCAYDIPPPPQGEEVDQNLVNLIVSPSGGGNQLMLQASGADCTEGWYWDNGQVVLCPQTCDRVQSDSMASLNLFFGCETATAPIT